MADFGKKGSKAKKKGFDFGLESDEEESKNRKPENPNSALRPARLPPQADPAN
jgi:hypothetical protein